MKTMSKYFSHDSHAFLRVEMQMAFFREIDKFTQNEGFTHLKKYGADVKVFQNNTLRARKTYAAVGYQRACAR